MILDEKKENCEVSDNSNLEDCVDDDNTECGKIEENTDNPDENDEVCNLKKSQDDKKEVDALKKQLSELNDKFLRLAAEYDNYRKRSEREKTQIYSEATVFTLIPLLPIFDTMDRAFESMKDCNEEQKKGFVMVQNQISEILKKMNVTTVGKVGEKFDPNLHNAVSHSNDEKFEENTISAVLQKGYSYNGKLVRPAIVQVVN